MCAAVAVDDGHEVGIYAKPRAFVAERVEDDMVEILSLQFLASVGMLVVGFEGEAYQLLPSCFILPRVARMSGFCTRLIVMPLSPCFFSLWSAVCSGR